MTTKKQRLEPLYDLLGDELVEDVPIEQGLLPGQDRADPLLPAPGGTATVRTARGSLVPSEVPEFRRIAEQNPQGAARFLSIGRAEPVTPAEVPEKIDEIEQTLNAPEGFIDELLARRRVAPPPPPGLFEGYDPQTIPLRVDDTSFETWADAKSYVIRGGLNALRYHTGTLGQGPLPQPADGNPIYALDDDVRTIAVFADFANGLPHTRYMAKYFAAKRYRCAVHLGDVYYAGAEQEVQRYLEEPLKPAVNGGMDLFLLTGNHEMYAKGRPWLDYIRRKHAAAPEKQRQTGAYFCLRVGDVQLVGADTAWSKDARITDDHRRWVEGQLQQGREQGLFNILLTSSEPYTYGKAKTTGLYGDMRTSTDQGLIDLWFWGNTHYGALFDRSDRFPFIGSCVGHGGYPYRYGTDVARERDADSPPVRWFEARPRYALLGDTRSDVGNNGFCELHLPREGGADLVYIDWTGRLRAKASIRRVDGRAAITSFEEEA